MTRYMIIDHDNNGKVSYWTLSEILAEINRDRSDAWTPYDETDWREGLEHWTNLEYVGKEIEKQFWSDLADKRDSMLLKYKKEMGL